MILQMLVNFAWFNDEEIENISFIQAITCRRPRMESSSSGWLDVCLVYNEQHAGHPPGVGSSLRGPSWYLGYQAKQTGSALIEVVLCVLPV